MISSGKVILCLAVTLCAIQASTARPQPDSMYVENVKQDLTKKCTSVEKDLQKESVNVGYKLLKESLKFMKKAVKEGARECVETSKVQSEEQLQERTQESHECVQELYESIDMELLPDSPLAEIMSFRSEFKNKLQNCKKSGKNAMKATYNEFVNAGKACLR